ncbi:MAG: AAA family ATPase, partial [Chlamydiota bacterium]
MKKLPIGIQSIVEILEEGQLYVDKTLFAKQLIDEGKHYFLSRPRRFGKSLFVHTLEHIFKGNKELFKGCQIYESDYDWQEHPVLHF